MRLRLTALLLATFAACGGGGGSGGGGGGGGPTPPGPLPFGLTQRVPVTGLTFPTLTTEPGEYDAVNAFPNLTFSNPIVLTYAPGDRTRIFVAEQRGTIQVFANDPLTTTKKTFLDIQSKVFNAGEKGFLGLAFDPDYASNRYFYVYYSTPFGGSSQNIVARFQTSATDPDSAPASSETILLTSTGHGHQGGCIQFGPDGHLYVAMGDGYAESPQAITSILGKVLRITKTGGIPSDNPYAGMGGGVRGEVWAYGLRNPWRMGFDRDTGDLWLGDVGQNTREEVDLIVKGGNYGWPQFEGDGVHGGGSLELDETELPVRSYERDEGAVVIGGYVYRGGDLPSLRGVYVHGDYSSGRIWGLVYDGTSVVSNTQLASVEDPVSFGEDADGEIYICSFDRNIYRLEETGGGGGGGAIPGTLSATGLFDDVPALDPAPGLIEFEVNAPLWSDGASKRRWIALPGTTKIGFDPTGAWDFPVGAVLVKHFELATVSGTVRLETRVLVLEDSGWHGYTYRWNEAQTDALLLSGAETGTFDVADASAPGGVRTQTWRFPSRTDCLSCHTSAAGRVLGVRARQLNRDFDYPAATDNQLRSWNNIGLFTTDIGDHAQYEAMPDPSNAAVPLAERARAYLDANCSICHRPGGPTGSAMDLRYGTALASANVVDVTPASGDLGLVDARIVASGSKERSVLWERIRRSDAARMPPLASTVVDPSAVDLIGGWIDVGPE